MSASTHRSSPQEGLDHEDKVEPGRRARSRTATHRRIERAAIGAVLDTGLRSATIDVIADRADVSRRTFFNHFDSKESALLGRSGVVPDVERIVSARNNADDGDLLSWTAAIVVEVVSAMFDWDVLGHDRREILRRYPAVLVHARSEHGAMVEQLVVACARKMAEDAHWSIDEQFERQALARIVVELCISAVVAVLTDDPRTADANRPLTSGVERWVRLLRRAIGVHADAGAASSARAASAPPPTGTEPRERGVDGHAEPQNVGRVAGT